MPSVDITVTNKLGLHARASAKLTQLASKHRSDIMSDPRLPWLASALSGLGSSGAAVPGAAALASDPAVSAWLAGAPEAKLLSAYVLSAERDPARSVRFTNEVGALAQAGAEDAPAAEVHLIRLDGGAAAAASAPEGAPAAQQSAEEFAKQVLVTNTGGNAVLGLYELIHSVFAPKLLGSVGTETAMHAAPACDSAAQLGSRCGHIG